MFEEAARWTLSPPLKNPISVAVPNYVCGLLTSSSRGVHLRTKNRPRSAGPELLTERTYSNWTPCAFSGFAFPQKFVVVCLRMYCFQESEPDSRPPPVSFSPPNAPPISAPEGPMLTLAMPQSEPQAERNCSASRTESVKTQDERPCGTAFCRATASSKSDQVRA